MAQQTERITAPKVMNELKLHLNDHKNKYDDDLEKLNTVVFGEKGDNGLCGAFALMGEKFKNIDKKFNEIKGIGIAIIVAIVVEFLLSRLQF